MTASIEKLAEETGLALKKQGLMLVTAESCTGGGISYWITHIPGSSDWFERGFVTYSDISKMELLGINPQTIENFGAVSEQTAREMAQGALQHSHGDMSIAVTGIAGPSGGSRDKPVGTVWIAWAKREAFVYAEKQLFSGDREAIRQKTIETALKKLLELIE